MNSGKTIAVIVLMRAKLLEKSAEYAILKHPFVKKAIVEMARNEK